MSTATEHYHTRSDGNRLIHDHHDGDKPHSHSPDYSPHGKPGTNWPVISAAICALIAVIGFYLMLSSASDASACLNGASMTDPQTCSYDTALHSICEFAIVVFSIGFLASVIVAAIRKTEPNS